MLYRLSKIIPVPMSSTYIESGCRRRSVWVQWRDRVYAHRLIGVACGCPACAARIARGQTS